MGFVGSGGNIAISTALPPSFCVLYCKHQIVYGFSISCFLCLPEDSVYGCGDSPGPAASCFRCLQTRVLCRNVRGLAGNLSALTVASSQDRHTVVLLDFGLRFASRVGVFTATLT